jgi:hypothetical protein
VQDLNLSLFDEDADQRRLARVIDGLQKKSGVNMVTVGLRGERYVHQVDGGRHRKREDGRQSVV